MEVTHENLTTAQQDILTEAREWIDTRFQHQARVKGLACDCAGLVIGVGIAARVLHVDFDSDEARRHRAYGRTPNPEQMRAALDHWLVPIKKHEAVKADIVYRKYGGNPQHLAILTGPLTMPMSGIVHAVMWPDRRVVEHRTDEDWYHNVIGAWRYPGLDR